MSYDPLPTYPVRGGRVRTGHRELALSLRRLRDGVVAIDGPAALAWEPFVAQLAAALRAERVAARWQDMREAVDAGAVGRAVRRSELPGDPAFARLSDASIGELVATPSFTRSTGALTVVFGPGSALARHDVLWYADTPKRDQLAAIRRGVGANLGAPPGANASEQRLLFFDWPVQERHLRVLATRLDVFVDASDPLEPRLVDGTALRDTLADLAAGPFRTRPTFLPGSWGGQWLRERLGIRTEAPNLAWSYELIAPEASVLVADGERAEVPFELMLATDGEHVLGRDVAARFDGAFPIRFDYLDTMRGGHLSIQCHPRPDYMRRVFGGSYTQDETYYVVDTSPAATVFLGLRADADVAAFEHDARAALDGEPFDPSNYLQTHRAQQHALYLIPGGTAHASGAGNLVLEISATPYLYTLRFYDWLRRDLHGKLRPVHVDHAFANLDPTRRGDAVRDLIQDARELRSSDGAREVAIGVLPELFFAVHRLEFDDEIEDDTGGRFHLLNLVQGEEAVVEAETGRRHALSYAETIVVPAATGRYRLVRARGSACKVVKAFVR
jgi:mannose-6-phosphate isomerase class I